MSLRDNVKRYFSYNPRLIFDKLALKHFRQCHEIIDIGCGNGRFIGYDKARIQGIDGNNESVKYCCEMGYKVIKCQATDLPFEDESFAGVHCSHLIEHLNPPEAWKLLSELMRILKKGGVLCLRAPLMTPTFYNDLTHIKPYPPEAILRCLENNWNSNDPQSMAVIKGSYKVISINWRHLQLGTSFIRQPLLSRIFEVMARVGIRDLRRSGYLLVLRKQ
jgi:SAM-dependent methyltransferase